MQDSAIMICYRECLLNLEKFKGGEEYKLLQFIHNIERIGKMIDANDHLLYCMCMAKLDGEAQQRFTTSDSSSEIFEQLKERREEQQHQCYVYQEQFLSHNNLQQHLHQKCYPSEASLENNTINILDEETLNYNDREGGHVRDEPSNEIENVYDDGIQQNTMNDQNQQYIHHKPLTRSQRQNHKHRAKRYRYEIILKIYRKFTITDIKKILIFMDIPYVNTNVVGSTLFLGVKNEQIKNNIDEILHSVIFTKKHYYYRRKKLRPDK
ncbi:unnamed protein product [Rotaria magnacalcarata]|uniref:Uncharacterized protein n=3 Tax=Rotaria magnacalcarata TaxID=392030 RepID=A0A814DRU6_9BILA|nr:unnamed protein product [Rotaria magnacalcarata]CAF4360748.1 unnamed protein product [Rotaria magnacalcarata]